MGFYTTANLVLVVGLGTSATCYAVFHMSERTGIIAAVGEFVADIFFPLEEAQWRAQQLGGRDKYDDRYTDGNAKLLRPACVPCPDVVYDRRSLVGYATPADQREGQTQLSINIDEYGTLPGILKGIFYDTFAGKPGKLKVWADSASPVNSLRVPVNRTACAPVTGAVGSGYRGDTTNPLVYMANVLCGQHERAFIDYVQSKGKTAFNPQTQYNKTYFPHGSPFWENDFMVGYTEAGPIRDFKSEYYYKGQNGLGGRLGARRVFLPPRLKNGLDYPKLTGEHLQEVGYLAFYYPYGKDAEPYPQFDVTYSDKPVYDWSQADMRRYCEVFLSGASGPWQQQSVLYGAYGSSGAPTSILARQQ